MKKGLAILMAAIVLFCLMGGGASALEDMQIGRDFSVTGAGIISSDLEVKTQPYFGGIKLDERLSTPGGGFGDPSYVEYSSSFEIGMYNMTGDNSSAEIDYVSTSKILNSKRAVYMRNYELGAVMGFEAKGDNDQEISIYSEDSSMEAEVSGEVNGKLKLTQKVADANDRHTILARDVIELSGEYTYEWSAFTEKVEYPAAGECSDWLGCP